MNNSNKTIFWVIAFSIAMGLLESAVVVYLRELYYPAGFKFPLQTIPPHIARVEVLRELATVIMLVGVGVLAGNSRLERFAFFVLSFAIWDFMYYVFLFVFLSWPESLSTWDILFLIPVPWVGPVWAPCLLCLLMITGSLFIVRLGRRYPKVTIPGKHWFIMIAGALICILAFMWDYFLYACIDFSFWSLISSNQLFEEFKFYVPERFNTPLFLSGFLLMSLSLFLFTLKSKSYEK